MSYEVIKVEYEFKTLELLRDKTILDPISYFKVCREKRKAEVYQRTINKLEHCHLGVDFSKANQLETDLRYFKWKRRIFYYWYDNFRNKDFEIFALEMLKQQEPGNRRILKKQ